MILRKAKWVFDDEKNSIDEKKWSPWKNSLSSTKKEWDLILTLNWKAHEMRNGLTIATKSFWFKISLIQVVLIL